MAAAVSVMGSPLKDSGASQFSVRARIPAKSTMARKKPRPEPKELAMDSPKEYFSVMLSTVTPSTAQLVVISGR